MDNMDIMMRVVEIGGKARTTGKLDLDFDSIKELMRVLKTNSYSEIMGTLAVMVLSLMNERGMEQKELRNLVEVEIREQLEGEYKSLLDLSSKQVRKLKTELYETQKQLEKLQAEKEEKRDNEIKETLKKCNEGVRQMPIARPATHDENRILVDKCVYRNLIEESNKLRMENAGLRGLHSNELSLLERISKLEDTVRSSREALDRLNVHSTAEIVKSGKKIAYKHEASNDIVKELIKQGKSVTEICETTGVSRTTIWRRMKQIKGEERGGE